MADITGTPDDDTLTGTAGNDTLQGLDGDDTLNGMEGANTLSGGLGDDTYIVGTFHSSFPGPGPAQDTLIELPNQGIDTVRTSINFTLAADFENLVLHSALGDMLRFQGIQPADVFTLERIADQGNPIVGAWAGTDGANQFVITFLADGSYLHAEDGPSAFGGHTGMERGSYEWNAETDEFASTTVTDTNGTWGLSDSDITSLTVDGNTMTVTDHGEKFALTRVVDAGKAIVGSWRVADSGEGADHIAITFLSNGTYFMAEEHAVDDPFGANGMERGTYTWNATTGAFDPTTLVDTTEEWGLSDGTLINAKVLSGTGAGNAAGNLIQGNEWNNTLLGLAGDDTLEGLAGNDRLEGGLGNDRLDGGSGGDAMLGGAGNDAYVVDSAVDTVTELAAQGDDTVESSVTHVLAANLENLVLTGDAAINGTGNAGNNVITGNGAANLLSGGVGNDRLNGGAGIDTMVGGLGNDTFVVESEGDVVTELAAQGTDTIESFLSYALAANFENLTLLGLEAVDGTGNAAANIIVGNAATNLLDGGLGNDTLFGGDGSDVLAGGGGNDLLDGGAGHDEFNGGDGKDTLRGGMGDDAYILGAGDVIIELAGEGWDLVFSPFSLTLGANLERLLLAETAPNGTGNVLDNTLTGNALNNVLDGGAGNDLLDGLTGDDRLLGQAGEDDLRGWSGNDRLDGGADDDTMTGGQGNDTYVIGLGFDFLVEEFEGGIDTVESSITYSLQEYFENLTLTGVLAINGTGNAAANIMTGNAAANVLNGGNGNDTLNGGAGIDTLIGGLGDDLFVFTAGDTLVEAADQGTDTVTSAVAVTLAANVEKLVLTGAASVAGTGNELDNIITGNGGANTLNGGAGDDQLDGGAGKDSLRGGLGHDIYYLGAGDVIVELVDEGDDQVFSGLSYVLAANVEELFLTGVAALNGTGNVLNNGLYGNAANNVLDGGAGHDWIYGNGGDDRLIGGDSSDELYGNEGNDRLDGGAGLDWMEGGAGNDTYVVDFTAEILSESPDAGTDTVESSANFILSLYFENLILTGALAINGTGNAVANAITGNAAANVINGGGGDDALNGGAGNDSLSGGDGDDTFDGGLGADTLVGGDGHDMYVFGVGDIIIEGDGLNSGNDAVQSVVSVTLAANVENLQLTGKANVAGMGNELANRLFGNAGANTLDGGAGNDLVDGAGGKDVMRGGAGDDTYFLGAGDVIVELSDEGIDQVWTTLSYVLAANIEYLFIDGGNAANGTGNALDNTVSGNTANNVLDGAAGNDWINGNLGDDRLFGQAGNDELLGDAGKDWLDGGAGDDAMDGGAGDDTYVVGLGTDTLIEDADAGLDTVQSTIGYELGGNFENLILGGALAINGAGNALDNVLTGNAAANVLEGNDGNDKLLGLAGNDTLNGGAGNDVLDGGVGIDALAGGSGDDTFIFGAGDTVVEEADGGSDTELSAVTATLFANVENLTLTGKAAISGTGNELNNVITGNAAANVLTGAAGNDTLDGLGGKDSLLGGEGNDTFYYRAGALIVELADAGTDEVQSGLSYTLTANVENLTLTGALAINGTGNALGNIITGNDAVNILVGGAGDDTLYGGAGNDVLNGGDGVDFLYGGLGNDRLDGGAGSGQLRGGLGDDIYVLESALNTVALVVEQVGEGTDTVITNTHANIWGGGAGFDTLENVVLTGVENTSADGNELGNVMTGNSGNNFMRGRGGNDVLSGGAGNDSIEGNEGTDVLNGDAGNDILRTGNFSSDTLRGGKGDDRYVVESISSVTLTELANEGIDTVEAWFLSSFTLGANFENLVLVNNSICAGIGNALNNVITGSDRANTLTGGAGRDSFVFDKTLDPAYHNIDTITDFVHGVDKIVLDLDIFTALGATGALQASDFGVGASATTPTMNIVYNAGTGALYYDADGQGGAEGVQFATLITKPLVSATDFLVV